MREYLGNSVFAEFDGYHVVLTTGFDQVDMNPIRLDPSMAAALVGYVKGFRAKKDRDEPPPLAEVVDEELRDRD